MRDLRIACILDKPGVCKNSMGVVEIPLKNCWPPKHDYLSESPLSAQHLQMSCN